jgi:hypothetical protein
VSYPGFSPLERRDRRRRRRREDVLRWSLRVLIVLAVFGAGIALGEALHDNPRPDGTITLERTLSIPTGSPGSTVTP